ncbi:MAG TPA: hydroxyethylthiazole kinase [Polyangiales bacterium]
MTLTANELWSDVLAVRERGPLVHCITNLVAANFNANALLAVGASPVMAHAHEEVVDMASIAQALVLNIGTLDAYQVDAMALALARAAQRGIPSVLDPVGAGATPSRNRAVERLLAVALPSVIRGNASEIMSVAGVSVATRGVDSNAESDQALHAAQQLAKRCGGTVCVSGAVDHVVNADGRWVRLANGHPWMTKITAVGCTATALVGAFATVSSDTLRATVSAMAYLGVAGQLAAEQVQARGRGVGTMQALLLDALQHMSHDAFAERLAIESARW